MQNHPARLIQRKRDGRVWTDAEIRDAVCGVVDGSLTDAQLGAWLMAVCCRGLTPEETGTLTLAMRDSGDVLDLSAIPGKKVDKHSTGGVGDKVSLLLAPLVAAAGVPVPMISGRGLGHTGGTLDKLAAIPGYRTDLSVEEFVVTLAECGFVMAGASDAIAPADRRMYATRDVTGTVESVPLITASILSKKLAEGIDGLVLDVKCGRAAFMKTREDATELMQSLVAAGRAAGVDVVALLTDMDTPLGRAVGNSLEVAEVVDCLRGGGPTDLIDLTLALGAEMLVLADVAADTDAATERLRSLLADGSALEKCRQNVLAQHGNPAFLDDPTALGVAPHVVPHTWDGVPEAYVTRINPLEVGLAAMDLGAGRARADDTIDPLVGVVLDRKLGEKLTPGEPVFTVHARDAAAAEAAGSRIAKAYRTGPKPPTPQPVVLDRSA